jgi:hypothetical protein
MPPTPTNYVYEPLRKGIIRRKQCIRLIHLLPGPKEAKVQIYLSRDSIENSWPHYEALSYSWGTDDPIHEIEIFSKLPTAFRDPSQVPNPKKSRLFMVRPNLRDALIHLRREQFTRVLWIDAICLDQGNDGEKESEIGRMGDIYAKADGVVIWLGKGSTRTGKAFQWMSLLGNQVKWDAAKNRVLPVERYDSEWKNWQDEPFDDETWSGIIEVTSSDWFRRVWIWQGKSTMELKSQ